MIFYVDMQNMLNIDSVMLQYMTLNVNHAASVSTTFNPKQPATIPHP
jgi:hypothetical protein